MGLAPGRRLGSYEIVSRLGAGGMGEVYRARDAKLKRDVAIKVLPESLAKEPGALERFEREARAVAALSHPSILAIHDFGTEDGTAYAAMELLEGETLRDALDAGALPPRKALSFAHEIAEGLSAAHEKGIVHRDLKPENVFLTRDGHVKILDFGLAKQSGGRGDADTSAPTEARGTEPGTVMGTVGYMSPEQVRGQPVDHRSDIFSFGAMFYEMLSGRRAFRGASSADTLSAILNQDPPELSTTSPAIAPGLEAIVRHCLEKKPEQRFQSARDLAFDLEALASPASSTRPGASTRRAGIRRTLPVTIVALLALASAGAYVAGRASERRTARSVSYRPLTLRRQAIFAARALPDGRTIVFSAALEGNTPELFTVRADFPDPKPLGLRGTHLLAVSSKGELAVLRDARFIGHNLFHGTLARMPLEGGAPRDVLENVREADWSPDGRLAVIRVLGGRDRLEFPIGKVLHETGGYLSDPRFSPRGDRIAFFEHASKWDDQGNVAVVDLTGRKAALSPVYWGVEGLAWTPGGEEVLFSRGTSYVDFAVQAVTLSGRVRLALESAGSLTIRDTARDGRWLVTRDETAMELPALAPGQTAERDLEWLDGSTFPMLSTDATKVVFAEQNGIVGPQYAVCLRGTDGSPVVRLGEGSHPVLSPDGAWVLAILLTSPQRLVLYPTGAGEARRLEESDIEAFDSARFFPDGRSALVCGHGPGRPARCYAQELSGGKPRPVTPEGTTDGFVSPDGRTILVSATTGGLAVYPAGGGEGRPVPGTSAEDTVVRWSRDGRSVLAHGTGEIPLRIERIDVASGRRELVRALAPTDLGGLVRIGHVTYAPDETSYAYTCERTISRLFVVDGAR